MENLGATCYMNSLQQQLFMIPEFRYGILSRPVDDDIVQQIEQGEDDEESKHLTEEEKKAIEVRKLKGRKRSGWWES